MGPRSPFVSTRASGLRILHRPEVELEHVLRAIELHRANAARGREFCEHWGPASSVSRIVLRHAGGELDLAVKWNHDRGWRPALTESLRGSRAARACEGAERLSQLGIPHPETLAIAERRRVGAVTESFLLTAFLTGCTPLPVAMPEIEKTPARRRTIAGEIGRTIGTLHAGGLDHGDLKHSNLLLTSDDRYRRSSISIRSIPPPREPTWRRRVRALGSTRGLRGGSLPLRSRGPIACASCAPISIGSNVAASLGTASLVDARATVGTATPGALGGSGPRAASSTT